MVSIVVINLGSMPENEVESETQAEAHYEEPTFNEVYFGDKLEELDRDGILAYCLARKAGEISPEAELYFGPEAQTPEVINNPGALKLEGPIPFDLERGCFCHDPKDPEDHTTTYNTFQRYLEKLQRLLPEEKYETLKLFIRWIDIVESDQPQYAKTRAEALTKGRPLKGVTPGAITPLWDGIQIVHHNEPQKMLDMCYAAFEMALDQRYNPNLNEPLTSIPNFETYVQAREEAKRVALEAYKKKEPATLVLKNGWALSIYDVRGLEETRKKGAIGEARRRSRVVLGRTPDFVILIAEGPQPNTTKLLVSKSIEVSKEIQDFNARDAFAPRLNRWERVIGHGWEVVEIDPFGGHPGVVGAPLEHGTAISAETLEFALKFAFDRGVKTEAEMGETAKQLAKSLSAASKKHFDYEASWQHATSLDFLPYQVVTLVTRGKDGSSEVLTISEYEIDQELEFLRSNGRLITDSERSSLWEERAFAGSRFYLEKDLELALGYLNDIPARSLTKLTLDERLNLLSIISRNETAIDQIFNPYRIRWRQRPQRMFDWQRREAIHEMRARFITDALPYKIDTEIIGSLYRDLSAAKDPNRQKAYAEALIRIINSSAIRRIHETGEILDNLNFHLALLAANKGYLSPHVSRITSEAEAAWDPAVLEITQKAMLSLTNDNEWTALAKRYRGVLSELATADPTRFTEIAKKYRYEGLEVLRSELLRIVHPDIERLKALQPGEAVNLYVDVGRKLIGIFETQGIRTLEGRKEKAEMTAGRFLYHEWIHDHEIEPISRGIVALTEEALTNMPPNTRLRVVVGSSPLTVSMLVPHIIAREFGPDAERITYVTYRVTDRETGAGEFIEMPPPSQIA